MALFDANLLLFHAGTAYGLTASMTSLGMAAGPLFGGIMASAWGYA